MGAAVIGIVGLAVSAIGSGVSYISAQSAADTQATLAAANATTQLQAIDQQRQTSQMAAAINAELARKDQAAANANATAAEAQAEANSSASREATRSSRLAAAKFAATQRAMMAKGNLDLSTGGTLALIADTEDKSQQEANRIRYEDEAQRSALFREADSYRNQGILAGLNVTGANLSGVAAAQTATNAAAQAKLDLYGQQAAASAARTNATGSLFTSFGSALGTAYSGGLFKKRPTTTMNKYPTS